MDLVKQGLERSKSDLVNKFYRSYDPSLVQQHLDTNCRQLTTIGRGYHFTSYRIMGQAGLHLALSLARPGFLIGSRLQDWLAGLELVNNMKHPLIPPLAWGVHQERGFYVTPYGPDSVTRQQFSEELKTLANDLRDKGLHLDDYWQLRQWEGHPFVIDWSDLKRLKHQILSTSLNRSF